MSKPIYTGNGKKHQRFNGTISMGHSKAHLEEMLKHLNEKGWVNTLICPTQGDPEKFYEKIDDFVPRTQERKEEQQEQTRQGFQPNDKIEPESNRVDDLPFVWAIPFLLPLLTLPYERLV